MSQSDWRKDLEEQLTAWSRCQYPEFAPGAGEAHLVAAIRILAGALAEAEGVDEVREFLDWLRAQQKEWLTEAEAARGDTPAEMECRSVARAYEKAEAKFRKVFLTEAE